MRVDFDTMCNEIQRVLVSRGFHEDRAYECAVLFAEASLDGVYSHGLNRVPRFVEYIDEGWVDIDAKPTLINSMSSLEQYDGNLGPGNLNAKYSMNRAIGIAREQGIGIVALRNTNHWMRGGSYGWQAVDAGCLGVCWTNTESCMPPWGAIDERMGNNPLVLAAPREEGHVVLDMAMSQFSYGKLEVTRLNKDLLPVVGGYDEKGNMTRDPGAIEKTRRIMPTGYWKGSGLGFLLDLIASIVSQGNSTSRLDQIKPRPDVSGYACSQVFIAIDPSVTSGVDYAGQVVADSVQYLHSAQPEGSSGSVYFPGEKTVRTRKENLKLGIPVEESIWNTLLSL